MHRTSDYFSEERTALPNEGRAAPHWVSGGLAPAVDADQALDAAEEGFDDQGGVEEAAGGHGAVAEHHEVAGGVVGRVLGNLGHQGGQRVQEPLAVGDDLLVHGVGGVGEFRGGVEEGAAAEAGAADHAGDRGGDGQEGVGRRCLGGDGGGDRRSLHLVHFLQI